MLYYNTISPALHNYLLRLMQSNVFCDFYLVGGTALSLQLGHRISIDIDLFTNQPYGTINLNGVKNELASLFPVVENINSLNYRQMVYSLFVGDNVESMIKLDLCYDEQPIFPIIDIDGIRMASDKEIAAMKMLAIVSGNRSKDFWDIHELTNKYSLESMISWGLQRNPYTLSKTEILEAFNKVWDLHDYTEIMALKDHKWPFIADELYSLALQMLKQ